MIDDQLSDRLRCLIQGATQCNGFALVTFYADDPNHYSAVVNNANPRLAAGYLLALAEDVDRECEREARQI